MWICGGDEKVYRGRKATLNFPFGVQASEIEFGDANFIRNWDYKSQLRVPLVQPSSLRFLLEAQRGVDSEAIARD